MKYTKIESLGTLFLLFSLPTLPQDTPAFVQRVADRAAGLDADRVLFLTPSLTADLRLDAYTREGSRIPEADCLPALGAYLFFVAGLPLYAYRIETREGTLPLEISRSEPPLFRCFYEKSKLLFAKTQIFCKNTDGILYVNEAGVRCAFLLCDSAENADLPALLHAVSFSETEAVRSVLALSPRTGGYEVRCLTVSGEVCPPLSALVALCRLPALPKGGVLSATELFLPRGRVRIERGRGGALSLLVPARLLARGEYAGVLSEKNGKKTREK